MKISFDAQLLMKGEKTGIGWCAENILHNLTSNKEDIYQLNCFTLGYNKEQIKKIEKYTRLGYLLNRCSWFHDAIYRIAWNFFYIPYYLFFGQDSDINVFFNYVVPPGVKGKKVVFVYDMVYKAYPETMKSKTRELLNIALEKSCKRADHIITISEFSKSQIIRYLNIPEEKISIMPCGVDMSIYHPNYSEEDIDRVTEKYKIPREYLLYLGTLEPRKNIERLIQAYSILKEKTADIPKLVLAGGKGWSYESIFEAVKRLKLEEHVIFTGYVSAGDAPVLMKGAKIFMFPSLYEGFGMPPLEAMACGTPVLVSNAASLPEVVGEAAIKVNPDSIESIKDGIEAIINNKQKREELSLMGLERVKAFTWKRSAVILNNVFYKLFR